jgi:hypothetical protein
MISESFESKTSLLMNIKLQDRLKGLTKEKQKH